MMGRPKRREPKLFYAGESLDLEARVPAGHPLRRVEAAVDFSFVRPLVAPLYGYNGNESVDPEVALKLMFLSFFENVRSERELMAHLPLRLDWLWFCGMDVDDPAPDHSVLSKARRRWGLATFERVFKHVLERCVEAGLVGGGAAHADSTLLNANAALDSRVSRKLWEQWERAAAEEEAPAPQAPEGERQVEQLHQIQQQAPAPAPAEADPHAEALGLPAGGTGKLNRMLLSPTDPDSATVTHPGRGTLQAYRDHRLVDDYRGVVVATVATAGDVDDARLLPVLLDEHERHLGSPPRRCTGDSMYGTRENYRLLPARGVKPYLKKRRGKDSPKGVPWHELLPAGCSRAEALRLLGRRKAVAEGSFAEAHARHGHWRCRWRRRRRVQAQCYLVAAVQNIGKLARHGGPGRGRPAAAGPKPPQAAPADADARGRGRRTRGRRARRARAPIQRRETANETSRQE
jgi:transposase